MTLCRASGALIPRALQLACRSSQGLAALCALLARSLVRITRRLWTVGHAHAFHAHILYIKLLISTPRISTPRTQSGAHHSSPLDPWSCKSCACSLPIHSSVKHPSDDPVITDNKIMEQ